MAPSVAVGLLRMVGLLLYGCAEAAELLVLNRGSEALEMGGKLEGKKILPGGHWMTKKSQKTFGDGKNIKFTRPVTSVKLPNDKFAVVVFGPDGETHTIHDANDLQIEISNAAEACQSQKSTEVWSSCIAENTFGGVPNKFAESAFNSLWSSYDFWHLCNVHAPDPALRHITSKGGRSVEIIRERPLVVAVRQFLGPQQCSEIVRMTQLSDLVRAHTGAGGGKTATSDARETLTTNLFVNWDRHDALSEFAANMFDFVSEQVGYNFSYEAQEPINFLHYLPGFEYRPHMDGSANGKGKRMATTLVYCTAADKGGATVFPSGVPLRFQPGHGDLILFSYETQAELSLHAACPVLAGTKTTLTQWYRPDVSPEQPWDLYENWGRFHNPYEKSRWKGPRFGAKVEL